MGQEQLLLWPCAAAAFSQKVTNIEATYAVAAIIVNNIPGQGPQLQACL